MWPVFSFPATFDVLLNPSADFGPIEIGDIPTLYELTICTWIKLEGTWGDQTGNSIFLVRYYHEPTRNYFFTHLESSSIDEGGIGFFFQMLQGQSPR